MYIISVFSFPFRHAIQTRVARTLTLACVKKPGTETKTDTAEFWGESIPCITQYLKTLGNSEKHIFLLFSLINAYGDFYPGLNLQGKNLKIKRTVHGSYFWWALYNLSPPSPTFLSSHGSEIRILHL